MYRMISILLLTLFDLPAYCPEHRTLPVEAPTTIRLYDPILYAFMSVESSFDTDTVNSLNAGGILQIRPEMVAEVNRICELRKLSLRFILDDRLDSVKSVRIWQIVQGYRNPGYDVKKAAIIWNPLANPEYLKRIKKILLTCK